MQLDIERCGPRHAAGEARDPTTGSPAPVIALHCSGADGSQWRKLVAAMGPGFDVLTPSFIGSGDAVPWHGERAFTLLDEARMIIDAIDAMPAPVHLVGHSYGGGVALKVASVRPDRIASLSVYEPTAFHVLKQLGPATGAAIVEIEEVVATMLRCVMAGEYRRAGSTFVDYWGGPGAWSVMRPELRDALIRWLPKSALELKAMLDDDTPLAAYGRVDCPTLIIRGERARVPTRSIADALADALPNGAIEVLPGAGHMGPVTHARQVISRFADHIRACEAARRASGALATMLRDWHSRSTSPHPVRLQMQEVLP